MYKKKFDQKAFRAWVNDNGGDSAIRKRVIDAFGGAYSRSIDLFDLEPFDNLYDVGLLTVLGLDREQFRLREIVKGRAAIEALLNGKRLEAPNGVVYYVEFNSSSNVANDILCIEPTCPKPKLSTVTFGVLLNHSFEIVSEEGGDNATETN